jgi:protein-serine/threonine kinase
MANANFLHHYSSGPEDDIPDQIGSNESTPTGIATPQPDPADKRLPSIMHNYFQVGPFSGDKANLPRFWSYLSKPSSANPSPSHTPSSLSTTTTHHPGTSSESFVMMEREDGEGSDQMEVIPTTNLPTPPHSLLQQESDEMDLASSLDKNDGSSIFHILKKYLVPPTTAPHSRRQTSLPVSSVSDDPVLASHFSNPSIPSASSDAFCPSEAPSHDHEMPHISISSENLAKLTGNAPDAVRLKNTPPLTPRAMSNEDQSADKKSTTSAPRASGSEESQEEQQRQEQQSHSDGMDSSTDEIAMKLDEAFPRNSNASPQNGAPVGALKGKLFVKISEGRGLRPSFDPYVVCVFEWNEYISKGARTGEEEKKQRQMQSDAEAGIPMAIPMKSRQSSYNSALDGHDHKGRTPVTDPHWDHEAVL